MAELTGRLIDLVAEDNAIEDTIYHITRALDAERIDLDRFLKVSDLWVYLTSVHPVIGTRAVHETSAHRANSARHGSTALVTKPLSCTCSAAICMSCIQQDVK